MAEKQLDSKFNSLGKTEIRNTLLSYITPGNNCFTLPSPSWEFERLASHSIPDLKFTCLEYDRVAYESVVEQKPDFVNAQVIYGNAIDFLYNYKGGFNFIWLDLCSYFTANVFTSVLNLFKEKKHLTPKKGIFAVTFWLKRTKDLELFKEVYDIQDTKDIPKTLTDLIHYFTDYRELHTIFYESNEQPMVTIIFKNEKLQ